MYLIKSVDTNFLIKFSIMGIQIRETKGTTGYPFFVTEYITILGS